MLKFGELVEKNLIDANSTQDLGEIVDIVWDKPSGKCAFVTGAGAFVADKVTCTKGAVTVIGATATDVGETLIGKFAYDTTGKTLCQVTDVEFGKTMKLAKIHLNDTIYTKGKIYAVKDVLLIRAPKPPRPKKVEVTEDTPTPITSDEQSTTHPSPENRATNVRWNQNRKYGDFSFLIGKVTDKTITNFQGEVMIKHGVRVTHDVLRQAKISGKLIELCLHAK